jgi:serine/threonine-protein kinase RsbW
MTYSYKFACQRESLKGIRVFVETTLRMYILSEILLNQMILAVDEICANLIIHAHKCNADDVLELVIENQDKEIIFEIKDKNGTYFDWNSYQQPSIEDLVKKGRKGGVGLILVNSVMDQVEVKQNDEQGSIWRLHKTLSSYQSSRRV